MIGGDPAPSPPPTDLTDVSAAVAAMARTMNDAVQAIEATLAQGHHHPAARCVSPVARARAILAARRARADAFPAEWFGEPAWDTVLDLYMSAHINRAVTITSACIASNVPQTTALRALDKLERAGWIVRTRLHFDNRCSIVTLPPDRMAAVDLWLRQAGDAPPQL